MLKILEWAFGALGGAALVWKLIGSNAQEGVHQGAGWFFMKFPLVKSFLRANWPAIKAIVDGGEKGLEEAVNDPDAPAAAADADKKVQ